MLRRIYHRALPDPLQSALRRLLKGAPPFSVHYEVATGWPSGERSSWLSTAVTERFKGGLETFDFETARRSPDEALASPIVRDNLSFLGRTGLTDATFLDFGCGNGLYRLLSAHHPATARWQYVGVDINERVIEWCRAAHPGARFEVVEAGRALPFRDGEFGVVLASGVVHCIDDYSAILSELRRVAGEYLLLSRLPIWKHHPSRIVLQHVRHTWGRESHPIHVFNRNMIEEVFARLGFSVVCRDYGSEFFHVSGVAEPAVHNLYLLRKV